jgi:hypothetical protein
VGALDTALCPLNSRTIGITRLHVRFNIRIGVRFGVRFAAKSVCCLAIFIFIFLLISVDRPLLWVPNEELDPYLACMQILHEIVCGIVYTDSYTCRRPLTKCDTCFSLCVIGFNECHMSYDRFLTMSKVFFFILNVQEQVCLLNGPSAVI